jgi:pimeloyl-ACP methyl ester carboxylesterase
MVVLVFLLFWLWTPDISRSSLEAKYLNSPHDMQLLAGNSMHVRDTGPKSAPAVILIHGFGASLHTWEPWAQALEKDFRVVRFDLPGSGLSGPDALQDYSDARSMQLINALMDRLQIPKASLVGHSIGGRIAWTFAAHYPQKVEKLVLIAPDGFASPGFEYGVAPEVGASLKLMRYILPKPVLRMSLKPAYANPEVLSDALTTRYHELMLAPGSRDALIARMQQTTLIDPVPWLKKITAPTLLLWGQQDAMIPVANAQDYLRVLAHARLVTFEKVGHLPHEEAPEQSLPSVKAFLK